MKTHLIVTDLDAPLMEPATARELLLQVMGADWALAQYVNNMDPNQPCRMVINFSLEIPAALAKTLVMQALTAAPDAPLLPDTPTPQVH